MQNAPAPPPAPDPANTASSQTRSNIQTAIANAQLNRVNQQTPWGSITYTQGPPDANGIPTWSSNIALSPQQQQLLEQQQGLQSGKNQAAAQYLSQISGQPLDFSHLHAINDRGSMYAGAVNAVPPPAPRPMLPPPSPMPTGPAMQNPLARPTLPTGQQFAPPVVRGNTPQPSQPGQPPIPSGTPNINAGVQGNPLDALLGDRPMHGTAGSMTVPLGSGYTTEGGDTVYGDGFSGPNDPRSQQIQSALAALSQAHGGTQYAQLRDNNIGGPGEIIDPSKALYDAVAGEVTPVTNIAAPDSKGDWIGPAIMALMAGGVGSLAIGAGLGGAGAVGAEGSVGAGVGAGMGAVAPGMGAQAAMESTLLNAGILPGTAEWTSALSAAGLDTTAGAGLASAGTSGSAGTAGNLPPVSEGSAPIAGTNQPSLWQQALNNLQNGKGLLGMNTGTRTAIQGLLPMILRGLSSQSTTQQPANRTGGGH